MTRIPTLVNGSLKFDGKFTVEYELSDGTSSAFRVVTDVGEKIVNAVIAYQKDQEIKEDLINVVRRFIGTPYSRENYRYFEKEFKQAIAKAEEK